MIKEFCAENYTDIPKAIQAGAGRIELCDNLAVGGTTMIRPRGGNFVYNDIELKIMENDLIHAKNAGTDGVVFGCLTEDNEVDEEALEMLMGNSEGLLTTFHMAFDELSKEEQFKTIDWFIQSGLDRILTHGRTLSTSIEANLPRLTERVDYAAARIIILPRGGITASNAEKIAEALGVSEVHGTKVVQF